MTVTPVNTDSQACVLLTDWQADLAEGRQRVREALQGRQGACVAEAHLPHVGCLKSSASLGATARDAPGSPHAGNAQLRPERAQLLHP